MENALKRVGMALPSGRRGVGVGEGVALADEFGVDEGAVLQVDVADEAAVAAGLRNVFDEGDGLNAPSFSGKGTGRERDSEFLWLSWPGCQRGVELVN